VIRKRDVSTQWGSQVVDLWRINDVRRVLEKWETWVVKRLEKGETLVNEFWNVFLKGRVLMAKGLNDRGLETRLVAVKERRKKR
jgi:hypothetical protein